MTNRLVALLVVVVLVSPMLATAAVAQDGGNATASPEADAPDNEHSLEELRRDGTVRDSRFPSLRVLDEMEALWVVRYRPGALNSYGDSGKEYIDSSTVVERDRIRMFGSHPFDGEQRDYTLEVVYWQPDTREVSTDNGTTTERFANISATETKTVTFDSGMQQTSDIGLRTVDEEVRVTMWLQSNPDIRWTFKHQSVPTAQPVSISSEGDFWSEVFLRFGWIVLIGVPVAGYSARRILNETIVGPQKGLVWWLIMLAIAAGVTAIGLWWQATTLITRIPQLAGVLVSVIAFVVFLEGFDADIKSAVFERSILDEARAPGGDEVRDERYREMQSKRVIETDDGHLAIISKGWGPFIARWFADPAKIPIEDVKTQVKVEGPWQQAFVADPESEQVIDHRPPRLAWAPTFIEDVDPERETPRSVIERVNWQFVVAAVAGPILGYVGGQRALGLPYVGLAVGVLPAAALGLSARDGHAHFEPAPIHQTQAKATLAWEQQHYQESSLNKDLRKIAWKERLKNPLKARALRAEFDETVTGKLNKKELGDEAGIESILDDIEDDLDAEATSEDSTTDDIVSLDEVSNADD